MPSIELPTDDRTPRQITLAIVSVVAYNFINYLCVGTTLAILPTYVHLHLGVSTILAGLIISLQYIATFASRPQAGHFADRRGPRFAVTTGLLSNALSGLLLLTAPLFHALPLALGCLVLSRFALGIGESMVGTGATIWGIGYTGEANTARVISWNGACTYLGLAVGAPIGALMEPRWGIASVGILITALSLAGFAFAVRARPATPIHGEKVPLRQILLGATPFGIALSLAGMGFSVIATFITLYFAHLGWTGAALSLTIYGVSFFLVRIGLSSWIDRVGGYRVTIISCAVEAFGLALIALTHSQALAYVGCAFVGFGFSLVFPALGVELAKNFPASVRGAVIGIYTAFADLSFFLTGPIAGTIIHNWGYPTVFLSTAAAVLAALLLTLWIAARPRTAFDEA